MPFLQTPPPLFFPLLHLLTDYSKNVWFCQELKSKFVSLWLSHLYVFSLFYRQWFVKNLLERWDMLLSRTRNNLGKYFHLYDVWATLFALSILGYFRSYDHMKMLCLSWFVLLKSYHEQYEVLECRMLRNLAPIWNIRNCPLRVDLWSGCPASWKTWKKCQGIPMQGEKVKEMSWNF